MSDYKILQAHATGAEELSENAEELMQALTYGLAVLDGSSPVLF